MVLHGLLQGYLYPFRSILRGVKKMMLLFEQFSPASCHFLSGPNTVLVLCPKHS
jgi:hypothetical protein